MSHYVIGDVQGCFDELQLLCKKIKFNPNKDKLLFAGDYVNRGPKSLEVLDFCLKNKKKPLSNKPLSSQYPPGSTLKMIVALSALENNVVNKNFKVRVIDNLKGGRLTNLRQHSKNKMFSFSSA